MKLYRCESSARQSEGNGRIDHTDTSMRISRISRLRFDEMYRPAMEQVGGASNDSASQSTLIDPLPSCASGLQSNDYVP